MWPHVPPLAVDPDTGAQRHQPGRVVADLRLPEQPAQAERELTDGFNLIGISANPLNIIFGAAILIAMIANVQLARLRRAGRMT